MRAKLLPAVAALLAAGLYFPTRHFDFVWDDWVLVPIPPYTTLDWLAVWTRPGNGVHYLPLRDSSLILDTWLFGSWPGGFHLTHVVLFALAAALAAWSYRALLLRSPDPRDVSRASGLALASALVFVAHPLQVESVAFVSSRNGLLALVFALASALSYGRYVERRRPVAWLASLAFVLAALLSKQTAVTLPLVLLLLHLHLARKDGLREATLPLVPHLASGAAAALLHARVAADAGIFVGGTGALDILSRASMALFVPVFYMTKLLWPVPLTVEYDLGPWREHAPLVAAASALLLLAFAEIVRRGGRTRSLAWFLAMGSLAIAVPILNLLPTVPAVADRYVQLPLVMLVPLLLLPPLRRLPRRGAVVLVGLLVGVLSTLTLEQLPVWRNDAALFAHAEAHHPRPAQTLGNLGMALFERGQEERALDVLRRLREILPEDFRYAYVQGILAERRGRLEEAEAWYREASLGRGEQAYVAAMRLGDLELRRGNREAAREAYAMALEGTRSARFADAHRRALEVRLRLLGGPSPARKDP